MATPSEKTNGLCDFGDNLTTCLGAKSNNKQMDKVLNLYTKKNPARPIKTIGGSCNKVMDIGLKASDKGTSASVQDGVKDAAGDEPPLEDDVPPNFFDDFMSEDFIDGLNVVDTWDEEESKKTSTAEQRKGKRSALKRSSSPKPRRSDSRKQIRSRSPRYRRSSDRKRSTSKDKDRERRDPTKTQRDILRDKDRCAKDQKAKLISEKLRMVETGLVPPGMEMEVDIQLPSSQIESRLQKIRRSVERKRSPVEFDRRFTRFSPEKNRRSLTRRTRMSPPRYPRSRSRSPRRKMERRSIERRPENRSLERYVDERGMERRIEERSMERRMEVRRNMEERRENRRRSPSRSPKRRRSKTPQSDLSDRERWLRHRSRSRSPRRNKSFLQELNAKLTKPSAKKSFLKELKETMNKSNEMQTQPTVVTRRPHHSHYLPTPVPPPQNFIPQTLIVPPQQEYDQQFFIGQSELPGPPGFMHPMGVAAQDMVPMHMPYVVEAPPPQPVPMPDYIPLATHTQQAKPSAPIMGKKTLSKLFNDEKITLSDYLSLTGKFTDESRPVNIQNKIKVISDCQDIIKELSAEAKASGHFTVRKVAKPAEKVLDTKHQSPFKKIPVVRFQYTTRTKPSDETPTMASLLTKLLHRFGKEYTIEEAPKQSPVVELSSTTQSPPAPSTIHEDEKKAYMASKSTKTMFCQTDRFQCRDCEKKSSKVTLHKMIQTGDLLTFDVGCQVGPDDFVKSPAKGILKNNQSLASMTPAQLLAEARGETPPLAYSKHSFDSPSEPKRPNRDSFNDDDGYQGRFSRSHDFDNFDRYRGESERLKGPALFERDRVGSSAGTRENYPVGRAEAFGSVARTGSFGYQPKQATSWQGIEPAFSSRPEKENPQFNAPGRPAFNQPGQMPYRDSGPRLNANPVGGTFNHGSRF